MRNRLRLMCTGCGPETQTFIISATVSSFYVPLLIMTVMYALTVHALRRQLREQRRMTVNQLGAYSRDCSRAGGGASPAGRAPPIWNTTTSSASDTRPQVGDNDDGSPYFLALLAPFRCCM